ncbi:helicase [Desmophyllum pertusum]|uniref:Helicase n=1 Tax=Desmophyllum pertusum TaxID=174260 RepID=A0A9W9ZBJ0_9CNID|nr:helicase [Desmophyllum pertusum]
MLPCALSENHCSLLPGKDRLCLSVFLDMSEEGKLVGPPQISRTIVRSSCQLTYSDAQKLIDGQESYLHQLPKEAGEKIKGMSALAQRRRKLRLGDSSFDHWSNSRDDPENFEAHELVEEMMLLANEEIAKFISTQMPEIAPLRTQLPPKDHKLSDWVRQYGQFIKHSLFLRGFYSEEILSEMTKDARSSESRRIQSARVRLVQTLQCCRVWRQSQVTRIDL